jgi:hypothetical protein
MTGGIGASVRRDEDSRFRSGAGNYTGDTNRRGQHTEALGVPMGDGRRRTWHDGQDAVWHRRLHIALARGRHLGSRQGDRQAVSKGKNIAARAGCQQKPLPPRCRQSCPASIRDCRDWGSS